MSDVKFAIPKGSLEDATFKLLEKSWTKVNRKSRTYRVYLDDPTIIMKMLRPQEIPTLVSEGLYDVGITGKDWVGETNSDVEPILDLEYGKIRLVIAFPDKYSYKNLDSMIADYGKKKKTLRISSEYLTTASKFIKSLKSYQKYYGKKDPLIVTPWMRLGNNKDVQIHLSFGATEANEDDKEKRLANDLRSIQPDAKGTRVLLELDTLVVPDTRAVGLKKHVSLAEAIPDSSDLFVNRHQQHLMPSDS